MKSKRNRQYLSEEKTKRNKFVNRVQEQNVKENCDVV